jgi:hypothetical protein
MTIAIQATGTLVSGTGTVSPSWPTHEANDIGLLLIEHGNDTSATETAATLDTAAGFELVAYNEYKVYVTSLLSYATTCLTIYWARATSNSMSAPTVSDMGDHVNARIITLRGGIISGNPVETYNEKDSYNNSFSATGVTTQTDNAGVLIAIGWSKDTAGPLVTSFDNVNLTNLVEVVDEGSTTGNGGGIAVGFGIKETAGITGITSISTSVSASLKACLVLSIASQEGETTNVDVPAGSLTLTGLAPSVGGGYNVQCPAGSLVLTGIAPSVEGGNDFVYVYPNTGSLTLTSNAPTISNSFWADSTDDSSTWTDIQGN